MSLRGAAAVTFLLAAIVGSTAARAADDVCTDFKWDVTQERALFAGGAISLQSGADLKSAPAVALNHLYQLQLQPQETVAFASAPGRKAAIASLYAGLIRLPAAEPGSYRVALDAPFWIDVVANGSLLTAKDFQGQHGCNAPHKIVEFDLLGNQPFILQLSGASTNLVRLTITRTPARKF